MQKYLLKFEKTGDIRYISHLDLMRQFQRAFKRSGIHLAYSQGFNPHPKMSFGQPLSLGFTSIGEYLEFESDESMENDNIKERLNATFPAGIHISGCYRLDPQNKTAAALVCFGSYEIIMDNPFGISAQDTINRFLAQNQILIEKQQKKGKTAEIDIRPMIMELTASVQGEKLVLQAMVATGSSANLNPELLIKSLFQFAGTDFEKKRSAIKRLELFDAAQQPLFLLEERKTQDNIQ